MPTDNLEIQHLINIMETYEKLYGKRTLDEKDPEYEFKLFRPKLTQIEENLRKDYPLGFRTPGERQAYE